LGAPFNATVLSLIATLHVNSNDARDVGRSYVSDIAGPPRDDPLMKWTFLPFEHTRKRPRIPGMGGKSPLAGRNRFFCPWLRVDPVLTGWSADRPDSVYRKTEDFRVSC